MLNIEGPLLQDLRDSKVRLIGFRLYHCAGPSDFGCVDYIRVGDFRASFRAAGVVTLQDLGLHDWVLGVWF